MITVEFLGPIAKEPLNLDITNLNQLSQILKKDDSLSIWLKNSACAINDVLVNDKNTPLKDGDRVTLLPPVCGG
ncbi:MAG: molybdopterin synthase sulfur carrier subunit [Arcobacter sp.]|nr:MAG: molybdopterin synthase sulfur carrier subunit [Arcobacter sp.]